MCVDIFRKDVLALLLVLKDKDIKLKVGPYDAETEEQATLHFL